MRELTVDAQAEGKRLDRFLHQQLPALPQAMAQKFIRLKRVKLNGKPAKMDARLSAGDAIQLYIDDAFFERPQKRDVLLSSFRHHLTVLYEDGNLLLIDKRPGMLVHPDDTEKLNTLVTHVRAYLYQRGEYDSQDPSSFAPVPCNRIDRFTGGIVIVAKTREAMQVLNQKIREHEIKKRYLCIALGAPRPAEGMLDSYLIKGERRVTVSKSPAPGAQRAQTRYRTLARKGQLALLECELITGRTHQIRAQLASAGCPLLGDGQYGDGALNRQYGASQQALYAYALAFAFQSPAGALDYLNGQCFQVSHVPFMEQYFPDYR